MQCPCSRWPNECGGRLRQRASGPRWSSSPYRPPATAQTKAASRQQRRPRRQRQRRRLAHVAQQVDRTRGQGERLASRHQFRHVDHERCRYRPERRRDRLRVAERERTGARQRDARDADLVVASAITENGRPGTMSSRPSVVRSVTVGGTASAMGRRTRPASARLPARSTANASSVTRSVGPADGSTVKVNDAATDACAGAIVRVSLPRPAPVAVNPIDATLPGSDATTTAVTVRPGRTRSPVVTPVISTVGFTPSSTVTVTGTACANCPFESWTVASIVNVVPGTTVAGTSNPNVSARERARRDRDRARRARIAGIGPVADLSRDPEVVHGRHGDRDAVAVARADACRRRRDGGQRHLVGRHRDDRLDGHEAAVPRGVGGDRTDPDGVAGTTERGNGLERQRERGGA